MKALCKGMRMQKSSLWSRLFGSKPSALPLEPPSDSTPPFEVKATQGATAKLVTAAAAGNLNLTLLNALIAAGADVNAKDEEFGRSVLSHAVMRCGADCVKALIAAGANVSATDRKGAMAFKTRKGARAFKRAISKPEIKQILEEKRKQEEEKRKQNEEKEIASSLDALTCSNWSLSNDRIVLSDVSASEVAAYLSENGVTYTLRVAKKTNMGSDGFPAGTQGNGDPVVGRMHAPGGGVDGDPQSGNTYYTNYKLIGVVRNLNGKFTVFRWEESHRTGAR